MILFHAKVAFVYCLAAYSPVKKNLPQIDMDLFSADSSYYFPKR